MQDSQRQKVVLITGGNSGIGEVTALELAALGHRVYVACRPSPKTDEALQYIRTESGSSEVHHLPLDLGDFESVRACAQAFLDKETTLDLLINNAGLAGLKGKTQSGFEMTFGVCHMGHFLLTQLLLDALKASPEARIVNVASMMHWLAKGVDLQAQTQPLKSPGGLREYCTSKLANILFTKSLAKKLKGSTVTAYSLHPGAVATDVYRSLPSFLQPVIRLFMLTPQQGACTTLYLSTAPLSELQNGGYYVNSKLAKSSRVSKDESLAESLWAASEQWLTP